MPNVITRFAPSPTGYLHIGGARTALFNWLYAKHTGGKFLLRIEDTDRERSTPEATQAILDGLKWLGLDWDGEPFYQFARAARHREVAEELLKKGEAYHCYTTPAELDEFRKANPNAKFKSPWRDAPPFTSPPLAGGKEGGNVPPVVRIKAPLEGSITVDDGIRGSVSVEAKEMDDMVLLRSDGTPTYMLAVVVDDHDMGVTQVIRGDDHFTNTFRQLMIYQAMGWAPPAFAHVPLIHGPDGAKLSKRHGALGVEAYREMGYLPEALRNYLLRLGWAHGDDEIISTEQAILWFDLSGCGKSPARFDFVKLENLNGHYIREADDARLVDLIVDSGQWTVDSNIRDRLLRAMPGLKARAKTIKELAENAAFYVAKRPIALDAKATELLDKGGRELIKDLLPQLEASSDFYHEATMALCKAYGEKIGKKLSDIAQPLRAALSGKLVSPGVFEVMEILGKEETIGRLKDVC